MSQAEETQDGQASQGNDATATIPETGGLGESASLSLSKELPGATAEELRARLEAIRIRRKVLQEELECLQEEENRVMALLRKGSTRRLSACPDTEDIEAELSKEDLELFTYVKNVVEKATTDQASCREAQQQLDAIFFESASAPYVPVSTTGDAEDSRENNPANLTPEQMKKLAESAGGKTPELQKRQRELFVKHLARNAVRLLTDPFGNYFIQRGFTRVSSEELMAILESLGPSLPEVSCNQQGSRGIQKLVDCCSTEEQYELFCESIANEVVPMVCDLNANHVIHRILLSSSFSEQEKENFYHIIMLNCVEIGMNKQGCCMIQRCLESAPTPLRIEMVNVLVQNTLQLVQDPFGNYVIQFLLDLPQDQAQLHTTTSLANRVIRQVLHHIASLSCNKFSSNVIEKCLRASTPEVRQLLLDELTDPSTLPKLLTQSYANYVVQTAITIADENQFAQLRDAIQPLTHLLRNSPYGVKIEAKILKRSRENNKKNKGSVHGPNRAQRRQMEQMRQQRHQSNSPQSFSGQQGQAHQTAYPPAPYGQRGGQAQQDQQKQQVVQFFPPQQQGPQYGQQQAQQQQQPPTQPQHHNPYQTSTVDTSAQQYYQPQGQHAQQSPAVTQGQYQQQQQQYPQQQSYAHSPYGFGQAQ